MSGDRARAEAVAMLDRGVVPKVEYSHGVAYFVVDGGRYEPKPDEVRKALELMGSEVIIDGYRDGHAGRR